MNKAFALISMLLLHPCALAQPADVEDEAGAAAPYVKPYPHSSGAALLSYCKQTDKVVSQLRCDYYVQGVADLAVVPVKGAPIACIPQGQNRTQLMQIAVMALENNKSEVLKEESAALLMLRAFRKTFPCPKIEIPMTNNENADAGAKSGNPGLTKGARQAIYKSMLEKSKKK